MFKSGVESYIFVKYAFLVYFFIIIIFGIANAKSSSAVRLPNDTQHKLGNKCNLFKSFGECDAVYVSWLKKILC